MATKTEPSGSEDDQFKLDFVAVVIGTEEDDVRVYASMPDARKAVRQWLKPGRAFERETRYTTTGLLIERWSDKDEEEEYMIYQLPIDKPYPEPRKRQVKKRVAEDTDQS